MQPGSSLSSRRQQAIPVAYFGREASRLSDGRLLYDITLYRVKQPGESNAPWDYYQAVGALSAAEASLPMNPAYA